MLKGVLQLRFFILLLQFDIHLKPFDDSSLFFVEFLLLTGVFRYRWQVYIEILFALKTEISLIFIEHF